MSEYVSSVSAPAPVRAGAQIVVVTLCVRARLTRARPIIESSGAEIGARTRAHAHTLAATGRLPAPANANPTQCPAGAPPSCSRPGRPSARLHSPPAHDERPARARPAHAHQLWRARPLARRRPIACQPGRGRRATAAAAAATQTRLGRRAGQAARQAPGRQDQTQNRNPQVPKVRPDSAELDAGARCQDRPTSRLQGVLRQRVWHHPLDR